VVCDWHTVSYISVILDVNHNWREAPQIQTAVQAFIIRDAQLAQSYVRVIIPTSCKSKRSLT
jgi:hypothetical protein